MDWLFYLEPGVKVKFLYGNFSKRIPRKLVLSPCVLHSTVFFPAVSKDIIFHLHFTSMRIVSFYYKDEGFVFANLSVFLFIEILAFIWEVITMCVENRRKSFCLFRGVWSLSEPNAQACRVRTSFTWVRKAWRGSGHQPGKGTSLVWFAHPHISFIFSPLSLC